jgi:hypothetical protein
MKSPCFRLLSIEQDQNQRTQRCFSTDLTCAGQKTDPHAFSERTRCSATDRRVWLFPPLRTDAVNRGFCISLLTLEIVVLAVSIGFFLFFIPSITHDRRSAANLSDFETCNTTID